MEPKYFLILQWIQKAARLTLRVPWVKWRSLRCELSSTTSTLGAARMVEVV
jgi:hypothetical protein